MKIRVTRADIRKGVRDSYTKCPIARALKRHKIYFEEINEGMVIQNYHEDGEEDGRGIDLPRRACNFISDFDAGNKVKPFTFNLKTP